MTGYQYTIGYFTQTQTRKTRECIKNRFLTTNGSFGHQQQQQYRQQCNLQNSYRNNSSNCLKTTNLYSKSFLFKNNNCNNNNSKRTFISTQINSLNFDLIKKQPTSINEVNSYLSELSAHSPFASENIRISFLSAEREIRSIKGLKLYGFNTERSWLVIVAGKEPNQWSTISLSSYEVRSSSSSSSSNNNQFSTNNNNNKKDSNYEYIANSKRVSSVVFNDWLKRSKKQFQTLNVELNSQLKPNISLVSDSPRLNPLVSDFDSLILSSSGLNRHRRKNYILEIKDIDLNLPDSKVLNIAENIRDELKSSINGWTLISDKLQIKGHSTGEFIWRPSSNNIVQQQQQQQQADNSNNNNNDNISMEDGYANFRGNLSMKLPENTPDVKQSGYIGVFSPSDTFNFDLQDKYKSVVFRACTEGRSYGIGILKKDDNKMVYKAMFTTNPNTWEDIELVPSNEEQHSLLSDRKKNLNQRYKSTNTNLDDII
ncbi:hypothetical protein PPL_11176 [Heterostelium album PN500]|uniref:NADH:ubiquinone oxidoreductase intermediate-associated protein 30 domain-containing protein n=1 Tax=Heterostelium pallidum (strain ATCC 26659 / Pp 5 / PN500) TaxID=670386 RepID=D3BTR6_HETP5|nr:hypothetical protein PPL_11176 [Heterostelium album PN500]EFA75102.1 hypothetical protein PPL_11176 [Heterostelium album PN500]|eukprot:XP_020427236.1 hypothetical protein PPL_11176 [Heterostelium album PN500]